MSDRDALIEAMARAVRAVGPNGFPDEYARSALAAIEAAGVRMVPVQPTEHMEREMVTVRSIQDNQGWKDTVDIYRTGVAASPYAPEASAGEGD